MTVIDTKTSTSYPFLTVSQAATLIGVDRSTIYRWRCCRDKEVYRNYMVFFTETSVMGLFATKQTYKRLTNRNITAR